MFQWNPEIGDIIAAVIALACRGGDQLRIHRIYASLRELQATDVLLSGLHFSITGAVFYSRQIDETLRSLVAKGMLVPAERDVVMVRDEAARMVRARLRRKLPSAVFRSLQDTSRRFREKIFGSR
ncbi:MAG: hypothetical protein ACM3NF_08200 [Gemmatimonadota bacterium]